MHARRPHLDFGLAPIGNFDILKFFPGFETTINNLLVEMLCEWMGDPDRYQLYNTNPPSQTEALDTGEATCRAADSETGASFRACRLCAQHNKY